MPKKHSEETIRKMRIGARRAALRQPKRVLTDEQRERKREFGRMGAEARWHGTPKTKEERTKMNNEYHEIWKQKNPERYKEWNKSRKVFYNFLTMRSKLKRRGVLGSFEFEDWLRI